MKSKQVTIWFDGPVKMESDGGYVKITGHPCSENLIKDLDFSSVSDDKKIVRIQEYILNLDYIDLNNLEIPDEYYYSCLPLCLLDAIYSIGVRYTSTKHVIEKYCKKFDIPLTREPREKLPCKESEQNTIHDLIIAIGKNEEDSKKFAEKIVDNRQLTSSRSKTLKAEAVRQCANILEQGHIQTIQDFNDIIISGSDTADSIEANFKAVDGQHSGISFSYLKMLCGDENTIKPDRHILRFLSRALGYDVEKDEAERLFCSVVNQLKEQYPKVTPRALDYAIWNIMRSENK